MTCRGGRVVRWRVKRRKERGVSRCGSDWAGADRQGEEGLSGSLVESLQ